MYESGQVLGIALLAGALVLAAVPGSTRAMPSRAHAPRASSTAQVSHSALRRYDDAVDALDAPDICSGSLVTNDNISITAAFHICNRQDFETFDSYALLLDTDSNPMTGAVAEGGAEYLIDVSGRTSALTIWDKSSFEIAVPQP